MVAYPDRGAGNDPELFFFRGVGSLSQPRLNIFTVGNMEYMESNDLPRPRRSALSECF